MDQQAVLSHTSLYSGWHRIVAEEDFPTLLCLQFDLRIAQSFHRDERIRGSYLMYKVELHQRLAGYFSSVA
jgi:hypothetical protein